MESVGVLDGYFELKGGEGDKNLGEDLRISYRGKSRKRAGEAGEEPGDGYKVWKEASGEYELVVRIGSEIIGASETYLSRVVGSRELSVMS